MADPIPIGKMKSIGHLETWCSASDTITDHARRQLDVYTGWINLGANSHDGDTLRGQVASFLPIAPGTIKTYLDPESSDSKLLGATVTVAPAVLALDEAETIFGVDAASVALEANPGLPGVGGTPFCLVMRVDIAIQNGGLHKLTYQATTLWQAPIMVSPTPPLLPSTTGPTSA